MSFILGLIMVCGFLAQMWNLFDQFVNEQKTVAISYEEKSELEFPSFAFCDKRAYTKTTPKIANELRYNATTHNLENKITIFGIGMISDEQYNKIDDWQNSYEAQYLPTIYNGYCMLFEFHRDYPINTWACK